MLSRVPSPSAASTSATRVPDRVSDRAAGARGGALDAPSAATTLCSLPLTAFQAAAEEVAAGGRTRESRRSTAETYTRSRGGKQETGERKKSSSRRRGWKE